jgi:hypothetical protein
VKLCSTHDVGYIRKKTPDCIRKTWKNLGKTGKIWENPGFSGKCAEKIGQKWTNIGQKRTCIITNRICIRLK